MSNQIDFEFVSAQVQNETTVFLVWNQDGEERSQNVKPESLKRKLGNLKSKYEAIKDSDSSEVERVEDLIAVGGFMLESAEFALLEFAESIESEDPEDEGDGEDDGDEDEAVVDESEDPEDEEL